jgi:hypothetical protein
MARTQQRQQNKACVSSPPAPYFLDGRRLSSLYRGAALPPKILWESAGALTPSEADITAASELFDLNQ